MKRSDISRIFPDATKEQIEELIGLNGVDINAAKRDVEDLRAQLTAAQNDLAKAAENSKTAEAISGELKLTKDRAAALEAELNSMKRSNEIRDLRASVSTSTGVPVDLLTGETEEDCKAQADRILAFAKPNGYPQLKDGGEPSRVSGAATRDKFAAWAQEVL